MANRVSDDCTLGERTSLTVPELMKKLDICLQSSFFVYNDVIYRQIFNCPMGSPLSPIIANMSMEEIEQTALNTYLNPPSLWVRYVDDMYAIMEKTKVEPFHDYLDTISTSIKFTKELEKSGQLAFLDVSAQQMEDGFLQQAYTGNQHTRTGIFNIRLITRFIKRLVWLVHYSPEPTVSHPIAKKRTKSHKKTKTKGLVYQISFRDCNAVYVGETRLRSVRTRKREHADAVKTFN